MVNLFAYGGLMLPANLELLTGNRYRSARAKLRGFARLRVGRQCRPGIKPEPEALTHGRLYYGLSDRDLEMVSRYLSDEFEPAVVRLVTQESRIATAMTHIPHGFRSDQWSYEPWSYERLCRVYSQADASPFGLIDNDAIRATYDH